jgi:hypothetical protein
MTSPRLLACLLALVGAGTALLGQGALAPAAAPAPTQKSLQEIWDKIAALETRNLATQQRLLATQHELAFLQQNSGISPAWQISTVDSAGDVGYYSSLAFSPAGQPAISYQEQPHFYLRFALFNGSSWTLTTVDSSVRSVGYFTSLAFSPLTGLPAISYYNFDSGDIMFAQFNGSTWQLSTVDSIRSSTHAVEAKTWLAFSPAGQPAICYYDKTNNDLKFAQFNGSTWAITTVDSDGDVGNYCSLAFSPAGRPAISYYDSAHGLKFAQFDGATWAISTVDGAGTGYFTSLAFAPTGLPAISYYDIGNKDLKFAQFIGGIDWAITTVDSAGEVGAYNSLAFSPLTGLPGISYQDRTNSDLKFAQFNGSTWSVTTIDSAGFVGEYTSLEFTPAGLPAISYYDHTNGALKLATRPLVTSP